MLAVGILSAGALTSFSGFINRAADTSARSQISDSLTVADSVYNHLRPGGKRCYGDASCDTANDTTITDAAMVTAMQAEAGGELTVAAWAAPTTWEAGTVYVQVEGDTAHLPGNAGVSSDTTGTKRGDWIRLGVKSDSGATFCVLKITHSDNPDFEGVGYMSVNSDYSAANGTAAHCGGTPVVATMEAAGGAEICIFGADGQQCGGTTAATGTRTAKGTQSGLTKPEKPTLAGVPTTPGATTNFAA